MAFYIAMALLVAAGIYIAELRNKIAVLEATIDALENCYEEECL